VPASATTGRHKRASTCSTNGDCPDGQTCFCDSEEVCNCAAATKF
jgi:hypothetical protein